MNRKTMAWISAATVAAMTLIALYIAKRMAPGARLPIHWNYHGRADSFSDPWVALFLPLAVTVPMSLLFYALPALEPRNENLELSVRLYLWFWAAMLLVGWLYQIAVISVALQWGSQAPDFILFGVGASFILIGNQLGKSRSMKRIGLRTPWTLASEDVWIKTHRCSGKFMVAGGIMIALSALFELPVPVSLGLLVAATGFAFLVPMILSFYFWRSEEQART